jgi:hypothetical protein
MKKALLLLAAFGAMTVIADPLYFTFTGNTAAFQVTFGNPDHQTEFQISIPGSTDQVFLPVVGATVTAGESYVDSSVATSSASMTLTLTAVSATKPSIGIRAYSPEEHSRMGAYL